ncbi:MAG: PEGA domain-containing protein [Calditrichia bacterium]
MTSTENIGSLEVSSNVKGARILLNGKDSGQETDHVFTQLPLGNYRAQVQLEGYDVQPEELQLNLTQKNPSGNAEFVLTRMFEKVTVRTEPASGTIYIDNEFKGEGSFEGVLKVGTHTISFGDISGYKKPKSRTITLKARNPFLWEVNFKNQAFTASSEGGPGIEFNDKIKEYVWKMGYAFPYRNPKGNDAIKITFMMPRDLDYDQNFTLVLVAASSQEKYPLSISTRVDISIKLNNSILSYYYQPKFLEDLGSLDKVEWDITKNIRPGLNTLEISTTEDNNTFYFLKRVEIFN